MNQSRLNNPVALITGANSGIGEAIAHRLAADGYTIVVNGRREAENQRVARELKEKHQVHTHVLTGDVSEEPTCQNLVTETVALTGQLDVLINNAGVGSQGTRIADSDTATFDRVLKTNLYSCYWLSREAFRQMEQQALSEERSLRGAIINIASVCGVEAWAGAGIYCTSKHGMMALTHAMAEEGEEAAIRVAAICPAMVATAMTGVSGEAYIQPTDIANTVHYLLSLSPAAWPKEIVVNRRGAD